ncbi:MAG: hypothetical protein OEZ15_05910 [Gammaproteobacteria bacterium]|nr:hypothetical protein [Gammaproteobacteria bacterium]
MMIKKLTLFFVLYFQCFIYVETIAEQASEDCDPVVNLSTQAGTLRQTLTLLAKQYHFDLAFSMDADRPVELADSMTLSQSIKYLTADINTVMQHEKIKGCTRGRLTSLEVLPVGEDAEYVYVKPSNDGPDSVPVQLEQKPVLLQNSQKKSELGYVDNLELYAEEILLHKRKLDESLAPEQRQKFRSVMKRVRLRLEAEGVLEPKSFNSDEIAKRMNKNATPE